MWQGPMRVVSVTVNYKTPKLTLRAVEAALVDLEPLGGKAIIVENGSDDGSDELLAREIEDRGWSDNVVLLVSPRNLGFGGGNNLAFRHAFEWASPPEYVYLLNPDATPDEGAIRTLVAFMDNHRDVGLAGSKVRHEDGSYRNSAFRFPGVLSEIESGLRLGLTTKILEPWRVWLPPPTQTAPVDWVSGASVIIRSEVLQSVGMFDETFFLYFEETELCLRARRAGWSTYYVMEAEAEHIGQVSTKFKEISRPRPSYWFDSRSYYLRKSHGTLKLWVANLAFVGAHAGYQARRRLQGKPDQDPPGLLGDFIRHSVKSLAHLATER